MLHCYSKEQGAMSKTTREMARAAGAFRQYGKNLVFAMTIKLILEFWRNQEIPEIFWKRYEQVKPDSFQNFYFFQILLLISEFCYPHYV